MRISDWSSDVCSSDLPLAAAPTHHRLPSMSTSEPQRRPAIRAVSFDDVGEAIGRLLAIARSDTGQAARVADFLLAWWDGGTNGHFPLLHLSNRSEEHTSELQSLMRISYAVFCLKKKMTANLLETCQTLDHIHLTCTPPNHIHV